MDNENEYQDVEETEETGNTEETEETTDWQARATELEQKAIKQREKTKELKAKLAEYEAQKTETKKSSEPDYSKIAYLNTVGVTHPDDQQWAQEEAERLKLPLTDILAMEHSKARLKNNQDQREAMAGMPKGKGRGGGNTQQDIDYWVDRKNPDGTFDTPQDPALAIKVINARIAKEGQQNQFSDILYMG